MITRVAYITNAGPYSGVGHRAYHMYRAATTLHTEFRLIPFMLDGQRSELTKNGRPVDWVYHLPGTLASKSITWVRLARRLYKYLDHRDKRAYILHHCTNQTLSFIARKRTPSIVTVHDIIEILEPQDARATWINKYLYSGITKADHIITVSGYTKRALEEQCGVLKKRISVIPNGVSEAFYPIKSFRSTVGYKDLRRWLKLEQSRPVILYVGSEHPRKNVTAAIKAFSHLKHTFPHAVFIKVGNPGLPRGRRDLLEAIDRYGIRDAVRIIPGLVSEQKLNEYYNAADVLIYPSKLEGFGLPPLQAMAAGTPVVSSNAASLPEVVGGAALVCDPDDVDAFATNMQKILEDSTLANNLTKRGIAHAKQYSWNSAAKQLAEVYRTFL